MVFSACSAAARTLTWLQCCGVRAQPGDGDQKMLSQGFTSLLLCTTGASLSTGQWKRSAAVTKQLPKMLLFHSEIMTALTCFAGIPALCQAGESNDAELPNPPNIKGNAAVPMGLVLLSGHRNVASELAFEEAGSEVQRDPQQLLGRTGCLSQRVLYLLCSTNQRVSK